MTYPHHKPMASVSLDLDNLWSYLRTHGDAGWESFPSYLDIVVPRVLELLQHRQWRITWFIVGQDAAIPANQPILQSISQAGHEIGNHSFRHEPWLHLYSSDEIDAELARAEFAITEATGCHPVGFRGPGFSISAEVLAILKRRGYTYDASTFPTFLGPLARLYYFAKSRNFSANEKAQRKQLFGKFAEGFRPLRPYRWHLEEGDLVEIPVTTMPLVKIPIHLSYILYLGSYSPWLARLYFSIAIRLCQLTRTAPSLLLHPLDFMGCDDTTRLAFFPAMNRPSTWKVALAKQCFDILDRHFEVGPMIDHALKVNESARLPRRVPSF